VIFLDAWRRDLKIGILSPITIQEFIPYLDEFSRKKVKNITGLHGPSVDVIVHELLKAGHDIVLFTLDRSIKEIIKLTGERLTIYIGEYRANNRLRALTFFFKEIHQLRQCVRIENCDIVHAHWTYEFAIGALHAKCPVVITIRDIASKILNLHRDTYRLIRWMMDWWVFTHKRNCYFIANSQYTQKLIRKCHAIDPALIPNAVNHMFVSCKHREKAADVIISISNDWDARKNIDT